MRSVFLKITCKKVLKRYGGIRMDVKLGILGCGRGLDVTNGIRRRECGFKIRAVCDKNKERLDAAAKILEGEGREEVLLFSDYEEMLRSDVDAVIIASDVPVHTHHAIMALEAGKHVLSEIPTVYSLEEAKRLKACVYAHPELKYMVAENCCFWENIITMKRMYSDGKLGEVVYAEGDYLHSEKTPEECVPYGDPSHWRANLSAIRYLTHELGPLLYILDDEVTRVSCYVPAFDHNKYKSEKCVGIALFQTKKGAVIRIFICFGAYVGCDHNYALYGSHGMIQTDKTKELSRAHLFTKLSEIPESVTDAIELPITIAERGGITDGHGGADARMLCEFISCIREDRKPLFDVDFGIKISLPGIIAEESYKNGNAALEIPTV